MLLMEKPKKRYLNYYNELLNKTKGYKMKLSKEQIKEIKELTHYNNHTLARLEIAKALKSYPHIKFYQAINDLHMIYGHMPRELSKLRGEMEPKFMDFLKNILENFEEVYRAL